MTQVPWLDDHQQRVWRAWLQVNGRLTAQMQRNMQADAGLSLPDFEVLVMLTDVESGSVRVSDLARGLQWERSRLSHHLTRMEKRGLVARAECVEDGRGAIVLLTPQGRTAIEAAAPAHVRTVRQLFIDRLDEADLAALNRITDKLLEGLPPQG
ncbi:DNA-binding MarR family transcriptional regulator [Kineosphaera limosa]|uniref:Putative MarR family transcriptional regulator n=1 Tax=Kineosphaera limosa NBRC 100340 TaxID=1184609 RepID=K6W8G0_9MICO|nr:MarR family winged helix-turn-helix transcriptional regulator [Kineosphaera limosa]NYE01343.1 DNA-binding MarR family transcriptional regulator [Kineosphaera limosa]GAB95485.1 putative MarR family transcriptional regulator [Kineosphaera limosa NBRC 100340]